MLIRIIPACAGNTIACLYSRSPSRDHPRLRGEYNLDQVTQITETGSSPPARGIPGQRDYTTESRRIIPACAGNTQCKLNCSCNSWDHPRLRGEYSQRACYHSSRQGSSPPARGILSSPHLVKVVLGIIPACAGNTLKKA